MTVRKQRFALLGNLISLLVHKGNGRGLLAILRHPSPPHSKELDGKVDLAGFHHPCEGPEVAARVLDPALPTIPGGIVLIELQDVDHRNRRPDGADVLHCLGPGALMRPKRGAQVAAGRDDIGDILHRLAVVAEGGARLKDQFR